MNLIPNLANGRGTFQRWTESVKYSLVNVGHDFGWLTAANGVQNAERSEWLFDVSWYQSDHLTDVPLVADIEWGNEGEIKYDFEKLLVSRSKYHVLIFQAGTEKAVNSQIGRIRLWIMKYRRTEPGDRYLLAGWAWNTDFWIFDLYIA